jgi:phosphoribosylglycinamide formyltransferase 2
MVQIGTPFSESATKLLLLGSGELGKEVALEAMRFGIEVIALDRYEHAPAMQVAQKHYVVDMMDGEAIAKIIRDEKPHYIVPEIEAIATDTLVELEAEGFNIVPNAVATKLTMNREGIRRLAAEDLGLKTSPYAFANTKQEYLEAIRLVGLPVVVKPVMSSSGKGQSTVKTEADIDHAWEVSQSGGRTGKGRIIVEGFVDFDYEITLLTVRHKDGTTFCAPIGHEQVDGDYRESWQPQPMHDAALKHAQGIAKSITESLGGHGIFGVELFIKGDEAIFSEVSPRPHDTGLVTLISQDLSQFALHLRAIIGLPIPSIRQQGPSASCAMVVTGKSNQVSFSHIEKALSEPNTNLRLFGKPEVDGKRRMGVALALASDVETARSKARKVAESIQVNL